MILSLNVKFPEDCLHCNIPPGNNNKHDIETSLFSKGFSWSEIELTKSRMSEVVLQLATSCLMDKLLKVSNYLGTRFHLRKSFPICVASSFIFKVLLNNKHHNHTIILLYFWRLSWLQLILFYFNSAVNSTVIIYKQFKTI